VTKRDGPHTPQQRRRRRLARASALIAAAAAGLALGLPSGTAGWGPSDAGPSEQKGVADLAVDKVDSTDPVRPGTDFHYNVRIRNFGPDDATGVRLRDTLPESLELVSQTGAKSCLRDGDVYCEVNDIPHDGSLTVVLHVRATTTGSVSDTATVSSATTDPDQANNSDSESTDVLGEAPGRIGPKSQLIVVERVVNDNGGTATAGDFAIEVDGVNVSPASFAGSEQGTIVTLESGAYAVGAARGPGGYARSSSPECAGTIAPGETKTCTITNDDLPAHLIVVEQVINDDGGKAAAADFTLSVTGGSPSAERFAGAETPGTDVTLHAGAYSVSVDATLGYRTALASACAGTIGVGEAKTCTVTSDDVVPLTLALAADALSVPADASTGYTATLTNPNAEAVVVSNIAVTLPDGFSYQEGSTTGATTTDPQISEQRLSWEGPLEIAGNGSASFHFVVTAPTTPGEYIADVSGSVESPFTLEAAGDASPVTVVASEGTPGQPSAGPPPADPQQTPSSPPSDGSGEQSPTATTPGAAQLPPPEFQKNADVEPVAGDVFIRFPGTTDFVALKDGAQVPFGTEVDASGGRVGLSTVDASGTPFHADFYEGRFLIAKQLSNGISELRLSGGNFRSCKAAARTLASLDKKKPKKAKARKRSRKVVRHLWGSGKGRFRTKGRFIAATVHGTTWLTQDRCDGSRAFVQEGVVDVRDLVRRKTIQLHAGQSYVARPR
jgi:uncharacterized repeat protein (TIGR01451 family)